MMGLKKWFFGFSVLFIFQSSGYSAELITTVFNVIESSRSEKILVLSAADGKVYRADKNDSLLLTLKSLIGKVVKIDYNQHNLSLNFVSLAKPNEVDPRVMDLNHFQYSQLRQFAPTNLQSPEDLTPIFNNLLNDGDRSRSQCFKRAHMWAYDMWSHMGIFSQKIFIFYTKRYIQLEEFEWWFHVAPLVVAGGKDYVLDGTFMKGPITLEEWKNYFIKTDKISCPLLKYYRDYTNNQWSRLCYLMKAPMYYLSPLDFENREDKGIIKNFWNLQELQDARRSFRGFMDTYEGLDTGKPNVKF